MDRHAHEAIRQTARQLTDTPVDKQSLMWIVERTFSQYDVTVAYGDEEMVFVRAEKHAEPAPPELYDVLDALGWKPITRASGARFNDMWNISLEDRGKDWVRFTPKDE